MAVTGVFQADFESFYAAVQKADVTLKNFDGGAAKVESTLSRMTDSFSGRRVISEATLMAEVFERAGGGAKFTQSELSRMGAVGAEAIEKMRGLGTEVPQNIERMTQAATGAQPPVQSLSASYRQFDGVLKSMGINIGPQVQGIEELANASGKSVSSVGALGTAGLAVGAAFAGWQVGRWIADITGLDKSVESAWRTLLGYADAGAGAAANKTDTLARASEIAGREITNLKTAVDIIEAAFRKSADSNINWNEKMADAQRELRGISDAKIRDIETATALGATTEQLTHKFGLSADALKLLAERQKDAGRAADEHRAKAEALDKAYEKLNSQIKNEAGLERMKRDKAGMDFMEAVAESAHKAQLKRVSDRSAAEAAAEATRIDANQREIDGLLQAAATHDEAGKVAKAATDSTVQGYVGVAQQITLTGEAMNAYINLMRYSAQVQAIQQENSLFSTQSQRERIAALGFPGSAPNLPSTMPIGGAGSGMTMQNTFNIVDTEAGITKRVSDNIMRTVRVGSQLTQ